MPFILYAFGLAAVAILVARGPETVAWARQTGDVFRPQLALPAGTRAAFVAPAMTAFVTFGVVGFYAALLPSLLDEAMHVASPVAGGAVLAELFAVAAVLTFATRRLDRRAAMLSGLASILPGLALLIAAQTTGSLALLILGIACGGLTIALGYRGSLEIVSAIAPENARAGLVSLFFVVCFAGNALPVIGVGFATAAWGPVFASDLFAAAMALLAVAGVITGLVYSRRGAELPE